MPPKSGSALKKQLDKQGSKIVEDKLSLITRPATCLPSATLAACFVVSRAEPPGDESSAVVSCDGNSVSDRSICRHNGLTAERTTVELLPIEALPLILSCFDFL